MLASDGDLRRQLGALDGLAPQPRRFGVDADARWKSFRGSLEIWDRIDLLIRDASVASAAGFAPRVVFGLPALADDEPFGPTWPGADSTAAADLWQRALPIATVRPPDLVVTLARVANALEDWEASAKLKQAEGIVRLRRC